MVQLRIKEIMREKGVTSIELADKVNVTRTSISYIINGRVMPSIERLEQISKVLGVRITELFDDSHEENNTMVIQETIRCPACGARLTLNKETN